MRKVILVPSFGLFVGLFLAGCIEKPTGLAKEAAAPQPVEAPASPVQQDAVVSPLAKSTSDTAVQMKGADSPSPSSQQEDIRLLRRYFEHIASGQRNEADLLAIRTEADCVMFMASESCATILEGQLDIQKTLDVDPIPLNSVIIEITEGQKQKLDGKGGFLKGTTLWIGHSIRARGPGGKEFIMRSMGVLERNKNYRIIWGKRRSLKDTPRSPHLTPPSQPASEAK